MKNLRWIVVVVAGLTSVSLGFDEVLVLGADDPGGVEYSFFMGTYEVTVEQFADFANSSGLHYYNGNVYNASNRQFRYFQTSAANSRSRLTYSGGSYVIKQGSLIPSQDYENHPINCLTWFGAAAFSNWLSAEAGLTPVYNTTTWHGDMSADGYRMATVEEWIKAASWDPEAGKFWAYGNGSDSMNGSMANYNYSGDPYEAFNQQTTPVGFYDGTNYNGFQTTADENYYGLYDMSGNLFEWLHDEHDGVNDNPASSRHTVMGGAWGYGAYSLDADRLDCDSGPDDPYHNFGFRVVRTTDVPEPTTISLLALGGVALMRSRRKP